MLKLRRYWSWKTVSSHLNSADRMASKIQCMTARNNMCIKALLITSIYSIVKLRYYSLLSEFLLTQKTCFICSSLLVVFIPWRSLSKRRNASEINEKLTTTRSLPLRCWLVFVRKVVYFIFWLNLVIYFYPRHLPAPAPATSTRESRPATFRHTLLSAASGAEIHFNINYPCRRFCEICWEYRTARNLVFWKPWPAVELKKVLSVTKHGFVFWA